MDWLDKFLQGSQNFYKDVIGIDVQKNNKVIQSVVDQFKQGFKNKQLQDAKNDLYKSLDLKNLQKSYTNFKSGAVNHLKPRGVAIVLGALLGSGLMTAYNSRANKKYKEESPQEYKNAPQIRTMANLGRVYSGGVIGALAGLLLNKHWTKLEDLFQNKYNYKGN